MKVLANVIDISTYSPNSGEPHLVDTNVWLFLTFPLSSQAQNQPSQEKVESFSQLLKNCTEAQVPLHWCGISFPEIAHVVEKTRMELFNQSVEEPVRLKRFRQMQGERLKTIESVNNAWQQVEALGTGIPVSVLPDELKDVRADFSNYHLDGYDVMLVKAMSDNGVKHIITDDADFLSVKGIFVCTSNIWALSQAKAANKLVQ